MEMVLQLLDARDLMALLSTTTAAARRNNSKWPSGAVFVAKRALYASEIEWFAANRIPVRLPPLDCHEDHPHNFGVHYWGEDRLPPKYQWTLAHNGMLHRDHDLPAVDWGDGMSFEWWHDGKLHREKEPAIIDVHEGFRAWYVHGKLHRDGDKPARQRLNGDKEWWVQDKRHRDGGKPAQITANGKQWWVHDKRHRDDDLPAVMVNYGGGTNMEWWVNGERHRDKDLPAVVSNYTREWWVRGRRHRWWGPAMAFGFNALVAYLRHRAGKTPL